MSVELTLGATDGNGSRGRSCGRILLVAPQPFYADRGTPIAVRQVLEALSHLAYGVDVLTYPLGRTPQIDGVRVFRGPNPFRIRSVPVGFSCRKLVLDACLFLKVWRRLRRERYAFIHAVEEAAFPAVILGRLKSIPVIYDMQSSLPEQMTSHRIFRGPLQVLLRSCERWLLRHADVVVSSTGLAERVRRLAPRARVREWRFPGLLPTARRDEVIALRAALGIPAAAPVVLYSGTFEAYQGLEQLLAAVPVVLSDVPDALFLLLGADGNGSGSALHAGADLRERGIVRLLQRQPRESIPSFLAMADVLVSPRAYGDNLPLKIFDYLAAGRPIVATDIPGHRALLSARQAVLVKPNAVDLGMAISNVLRDSTRAVQLGAAARSYAETNLGWTAFVGSVRDLYAEAARERSSGAHG